VAASAAKLQRNDIQTIVDFLDVVCFRLSFSPQFMFQSLLLQALKDHLTIPDERNRVLALLSRTMTLTQVFPRRLELKSIKYDQRPIAVGGFGKVHRGLSDPTICVKVTTRVNDLGALIVRPQVLLMYPTRKLNVYRPTLENWSFGLMRNTQTSCLSTECSLMTLSGFALYPHIWQREICVTMQVAFPKKIEFHQFVILALLIRTPVRSPATQLLDTITGLDYLHGLGVVHTDLKGVRPKSPNISFGSWLTQALLGERSDLG
jgi:hypothetical protein